MAFAPRSFSFGPSLTPMVKSLILTCVGVFLLQILAGRDMVAIFGLSPYLVLRKFYLWQIFTYLFLHGHFWHLFWNMLALWMFGCELERVWGSRPFLRYFLVTGVGAGLISLLSAPGSMIPTIGASGSIYGILLAFGLLFPDRIIYLNFLLPVKAKYLVAFFGLVAFLSALQAPGDPVAHVAHVGGMVVGFLYLKGWLSPAGIRQSYYRWKLKRMRERFKVYESERRKRDDFWIH